MNLLTPFRSTLCLAVIFLCVSPASAERPQKQKRQVVQASKSRSAKTNQAAQARASLTVPTCRASMLVEANSGQVLEELNAQEPLPPASMVKMMTSYSALKKVHEGSIKLTDTITASAWASKVGGSQVYLKQGEQFTLGQLLEAVLVQSANDAATAIAEHIGGSVDGFVEIMNRDAAAIGMTQSEFHTPHGLPPAQGQKPDLVSARDFGLLARALLKDFPEITNYTSLQTKDFRDGSFQMSNHNHLLRHFPGADGLKTGFYNEAGFCITATAARNGTRMIAVVMGCTDRKLRDKQASELLAKGFSQFKSVRLAEKGAKLQQLVSVENGVQKSVSLAFTQDVMATLKVGDEAKVVQKPALCQAVRAPVKQNTPCGSVSFMVDDREVAKADLVIGVDVPEATTMGKVRQLFNM